MFLDRWRARRAILSRTPPASVEERADPRLAPIVHELGERLGAPCSLGDPLWHERWEGELQIVGLDARERSVCDVRQRLARTAHELALRHMARRGRQLLAVILCDPLPGEGLLGWHARLQDDRGEVGQADWRAASRSIAVLAIDTAGASQLIGGEARIEAAVASWAAGQAAADDR